MKNLILSFLLIFGLTNLLLFSLGQRNYDVYLIINTILFITLTLFARVNPTVERALRSISTLLFLGFVSVVVLKIMSWL